MIVSDFSQHWLSNFASHTIEGDDVEEKIAAVLLIEQMSASSAKYINVQGLVPDIDAEYPLVFIAHNEEYQLAGEFDKGTVYGNCIICQVGIFYFIFQN